MRGGLNLEVRHQLAHLVSGQIPAAWVTRHGEGNVLLPFELRHEVDSVRDTTGRCHIHRGAPFRAHSRKVSAIGDPPAQLQRYFPSSVHCPTLRDPDNLEVKRPHTGVAWHLRRLAHVAVGHILVLHDEHIHAIDARHQDQ